MPLNSKQISVFQFSSYILVELPPGARKEGVRVRLWQPHHDSKTVSDWAVDNIVIGGNEHNPSGMNMMKDGTETGTYTPNWLETDNTRMTEYCGSKHAVTGEAKTEEHVTLTTVDLAIEEDFILQFTISVGCNSSWDANISPVHLQYSTDYGLTWQHLVRQCLLFFPDCGGQVTTASIYYAAPSWRRETILLNGQVVSRCASKNIIIIDFKRALYIYISTMHTNQCRLSSSLRLISYIVSIYHFIFTFTAKSYSLISRFLKANHHYFQILTRLLIWPTSIFAFTNFNKYRSTNPWTANH